MHWRRCRRLNIGPISAATPPNPEIIILGPVAEFPASEHHPTPRRLNGGTFPCEELGAYQTSASDFGGRVL